MQFLTLAIVLSAVAPLVAAQADQPWSMTTWTGRACLGGKVGTWAVGPGTNSCITMNGVLSLVVDNTGPCRTVYYSDDNCATAPFLGNQGICTGFNGAPIGSFQVTCTD